NGNAISGSVPGLLAIDATPTDAKAFELTVENGVRLSKFTSVPNVGVSPAPKKLGSPILIVVAPAMHGSAHSATPIQKDCLVITILLPRSLVQSKLGSFQED